MFTLNNIMRANAISCIVFGLVFLLMPINVIVFLGTDSQLPEIVLQILAIGLIANGLHLIYESLAIIPRKAMVYYFSIGDFIWVIGSVVLLFFGNWITTSTGIAATLAVSIMVATFGLLQLLKSRELVS